MGDKMDAYERALKRKRTVVIEGAGEGRTWKGLSIDVSGSGIISDEVIRVSGSARLPGGIKAKILHVSGSASIDGDVVAEEVKVSGSASADGVLEAGWLKISGSFKARGLKGGSAKVSGSCLVDGTVALSGSLRASGSLKVMEDLSADESVVFQGAFNVNGKLKTKNLQVELHRSDCYVHGGIEATNVEVRRHESEISFLGFKIVRHRLRGRLFTPFVKASEKVCLENVVCDDVSGKDIEIGDGCEIKGTIQYSETVSIAPTAKVAKRPIKIEHT
jgi:cytoskeletal protein CcmA (bactofilin family)